MFTKTIIAVLAALATLSFGIAAYAAGDKPGWSDKAGTSSEPGAKKFWTREEALQNGLTEEQISAIDTNGDGKIDVNELAAAAAKDQAGK